jgi:hypothetical protein
MRITIEHRTEQGDGPWKADGYLGDWISALYFALDPLRQAAVRQELERRMLERNKAK